MTDRDLDLTALTATVTAAYLENNNVSMQTVPSVITSVYAAFASLGKALPPTEAERPAPAVPIRKSVTSDYIVCLEDGKKLKMLKRHLQSAYGMTPDEYRTRWGLPADYPMVAPSYAATRSNLAKAAGLGRKPGSGQRRGTAPV
ncbi:MucR family transcriptional regulator (plasmid) [Azospirillum baldaniorum]|nr:MucR family transcriptional regulator [Azospirillum baldaniorum]AWJ94456.1 MucR family transcriptional regulator [Azospirillum baldaniorum]